MRRVPSLTSANHQSARYYEDDSSLARLVADFLREAFDSGNPGVVITTANQRAEMIRELAHRSFDVVELERARQLLLLDAEETLSAFMVDGKPDHQKFNDEMSGLLERARLGRDRGGCTVYLFGQIVDVLWQRGERDAAIRLELLWNEFAGTQASTLRCGYAFGSFYKGSSVPESGGPPSPRDAAARMRPRGASIAGDSNRRRRSRS
jgi:hypothetical protein